MCVGQTEPGERSRRGEKKEKREENLGQTWSEPPLKRRRKCVRPVRNQYEGSGEVRPTNEVAEWQETGGLMEVCQLHNEAPPCP